MSELQSNSAICYLPNPFSLSTKSDIFSTK